MHSTMTGDYSLNKLFLPPIESLPIEKQLTRYRQRDLVPSHLHRIGTRLFRGSSFNTRRRVIDASHFSPPNRINHQALLNASFDGRIREPHDKTSSKLTKSLSEPSVTLSDPESEYRKWLAERKVLRNDLDSLGATEKWLTSKECTPLEASLLTQLRDQKRLASAKLISKESLEVLCDTSKKVSVKSPSPLKALRKLKQQTIKEITKLYHFLLANRQRFVSLLTTVDKARMRLVSVSDMLNVFSKIKAPLSQAILEILLQVLNINQEGVFDYQQLINGSVLKGVDELFKKQEAELITKLEEESKREKPVSATEDVWVKKTADLEKKYGALSTLTGEHGMKVDINKQEEVSQFSKLINYCKENGIVLNWQIAEKALLTPPDKSREECLSQLRQAGLSLLSRHFADSPQEQTVPKQKDAFEGFGRAYKEIRGKRKATYMRLPTGAARVNTKIDCWLTYEEYMKLTEHIRSQPGFKYKDHGLPDNNAFWPGALLDKLRLWLPKETLHDKPCSLYNVFQPVQHPKIYNPHSPLIEQKMSWPDNASGYVQFGSQNRKQYQL